jgi:hypothetical protein
MKTLEVTLEGTLVQVEFVRIRISCVEVHPK